jgi:hypothetical protein
MIGGMDLVRQLLMEMEKSAQWPAGKCIAINDADQAYHLHLLIQSGLVEGKKVLVIGAEPPQFLISGLTWQGHEFLSASADPGRWTQFNTSAGTGLASIPFPVIVKMLTDGVEQSVVAALQSHGFMS